jgi:hypothetical protein
MAQFNGDLGWIAAAAESTYGTLGSTLVYQQGISAALKLDENRSIPPVLGSVASDPGNRLASWIAGSISLGHSDEADDVGILYGNCGSVSTGTYNFGGTAVNDSLSFFVDLDGVEYDFAGCVIQGITWNLSGGDYSTMDLDVIGRSVAKYAGAARTASLPPASEVVVPGDLSTFTVGGTAVGSLKSATINWSWPLSDIGRQRLGSTSLPQPARVGRQSITATFNVELNDDTGDDTVDLIDSYIADTALGQIVCDNFALSGCVMTGDLPDLAAGLRDVTISVTATGLLVITS